MNSNVSLQHLILQVHHHLPMRLLLPRFRHRTDICWRIDEHAQRRFPFPAVINLINLSLRQLRHQLKLLTTTHRPRLRRPIRNQLCRCRPLMTKWILNSATSYRKQPMSICHPQHPRVPLISWLHACQLILIHRPVDGLSVGTARRRHVLRERQDSPRPW